MTDFGYPPTVRYELGSALANVEQRVDDLERRISNLKEQAGQDDVPDDLRDQLQDARADRQSVLTQQEGLQWAVHGDAREDGFDGWGEDAVVELQAFTGGSRARILDTAERSTVGTLGQQQLRVWLIAGAIETAPWLDGDEDLLEQQQQTKSLPPMLIDWLDAELEDLNELGNPH